MNEGYAKNLIIKRKTERQQILANQKALETESFKINIKLIEQKEYCVGLVIIIKQ